MSFKPFHTTEVRYPSRGVDVNKTVHHQSLSQLVGTVNYHVGSEQGSDRSMSASMQGALRELSSSHLVAPNCATALTPAVSSLEFMAAGPQNGEARSRHRLPPFSIRPLENADNQRIEAPGTPPSQYDRDDIPQLLPASYKPNFRSLASPTGNIAAFLTKEFDLSRMARIRRWVWLGGFPLPPRPLHWSRLRGTSVYLTEQMAMHLVTSSNRIFIKPLPRYLLEPRFWAEYLSCLPGCRCPGEEDSSLPSRDVESSECDRRALRRIAIGFMCSYAALIAYESDFYMALEMHLLPPGLKWQAWRTLVEQLDTEHITPDIHERFMFGELRLAQLNMIYRLTQNPRHLYWRDWGKDRTLFQQYFAWLAGATVYVAVVLTAMQVGLATDALKDNDAFQAASYGFTVFAIVAPLGLAVLVPILRVLGSSLLIFKDVFIGLALAMSKFRPKEKATNSLG